MTLNTDLTLEEQVGELRRVIEDLETRLPRTSFFRRVGNPLAWKNPIAIPSGAITARLIATGAVTAEALAVSLAGLVDVVATLPTLPDTDYPTGKVVFLTSDNKLYRNAAGTWTKATDGADIVADTITAGAIATGAIGADEIAANAVTAAKIAAAAITATKLNILQIIVVGATWTDNSPSGGSIAWSGATVYYNGTEYTITNSNTALKYIWWSATTSNTTFQSSDTRPTLTDAEFMIATNNVGLHDLVWNATNPPTLSVNPGSLNFEALQSLFIYGDGIDGTVTISGNTTLTRDMSYDTLTINGGVVLSPAGFRIFVKNTLTNNGTIRDNGQSGATGGAGAASGNMGGGGGGGVGGNQGSGTGPNSGAGLTNALGGVGGTGGNATGVPDPNSIGAVGGAITTTRANRHGLMLLGDTAEIRGGTGAGGGGGNTPAGGGGRGGGGAGVIIIAAKTINNGSGTIEAKGGDGESSASGAGGGGGGGGAIVLVFRSLTVGTISVAGGAKGAIGGGVSEATAGATGLDLRIQQEA